MSIKFRQVTYTYFPNTPYETTALKAIDLVLESGKFSAIIGHTGSGKSTLIQHINALLIPTSGEVEVEDFLVTAKAKPKGIKQLRKIAGLVFQFPEYQLFEETVFKDIVFGPKNFGAKEEDLKEIVIEILELVGLDESYLERSPFELSGGQKRRVAIAGILAMEPDILILDEPTAGLDPQGTKEMLELFKKIHESGKTIILVTHEMEQVLNYCEEVVVVQQGKISYQGDPITLFKNSEFLKEAQIDSPTIMKVALELEKRGYPIEIDTIKNMTTFVRSVVECNKKRVVKWRI